MVHLMQQLDSSPVTSTQIMQWTAKDPLCPEQQWSCTTSSGMSCQSRMAAAPWYQNHCTTSGKKKSDGAAAGEPPWQCENAEPRSLICLVAWY